MPDVFTWPLEARDHKIAVDLLRRDIIAAHAASTHLPIEAIFWQLPVISDQISDAIARGNISITGNDFENRDDEELWMEFQDPAMGDFFATIPEVFSGSVQVSGDVVTIVFDPAISLEIPQLAALGVARAAFQSLSKMIVSPSRALSILVDDIDRNKETHIDVDVGGGGVMPVVEIEKEMLRATSVIDLISSNGSCEAGGDPEDPNWYAVHRNDGLCFTHYGRIITGGQLNHTPVYGPATKQACDNYLASYCPSGVC